MVFESVSNSPGMEFFLPFFFVFAIVFALLSSVAKSAKIEAFKNNPVNVIISLVFAFLAAGNQGFTEFFFRNGPTMIKVFVVIFVLAFILEALGLRGEKGKGKVRKNPIMVMVILGVILLLLSMASTLFAYQISVPGISTGNLFFIIGMGAIIIMFIFAYMMGQEGEK